MVSILSQKFYEIIQEPLFWPPIGYNESPQLVFGAKAADMGVISSAIKNFKAVIQSYETVIQVYSTNRSNNFVYIMTDYYAHTF